MNLHGGDRKDERSPVVLLVDDDPVVRDIISWVIQSAGYTPMTADGAEGFRQLTEQVDRVALVLLDLTMHSLDGFRFREMQMAQPRLADVPTVVMSGRYVEHDERAKLGAKDYVWKPIKISDLRAVITEHARPLAAASAVRAARTA
jgi:CheY-like chemotaxis protein